MLDLRLPARLYFASIVLLAFGCSLLALMLRGTSDSAEVTMACVFVLATALVGFSPVHFAFRTRLGLDTIVTFAAVLLFDPGTAMLVAGLGAILADVFSRRSWDETLFNASQIALQAGFGGLILAVAGWNFDNLLLNPPELMPIALIAAAGMSLVNIFTVGMMVALQSGLSPVLVWRHTSGFDATEQLTQLALGFLVAVVTEAYAAALPLFLLPILAVYRSSDRHVKLRTQTIKAVESLADIVDIRDPYTAEHSQRVAACSRELATALGLAPDEVEQIERAARVHDIGKIVVELRVLTKEGRLDEDEWEQLKRHPETGSQVLSHFPEFSEATAYVRHHHERVDGLGYPHGLEGEQIPLGARIISVADSFDAMASARPYRAGLPMDIVLSEFRQHKGVQWDERVVDTLLDLIAQGRLSVPDVVTNLPSYRVN